MLELNTLYNMDCMDGMRGFPDKYFDLAIVDVPYGIGAADYERGGKQNGKARAASTAYTRKDWDKEPPPPEYFTELMRVSKNQIIWGANHFISRIPFDTPCWIVWDKDNGSNDYADCELAWTSFDTAVRRFTFKWHGMLQGDMKNKETRIHPTQKPVALYAWLLSKYAKSGYKILDTHAGSASSLVACHRAGFEFIGFEIDPEHYRDANERLRAEMAQLRLDFLDPAPERVELVQGSIFAAGGCVWLLIGLHDAEIEHIRGKHFPNYALMKIAAWHKQRGDTVELFTPIDPKEPEQLTLFPIEEYPPRRKADIYDLVYSSKVFDFTPENPYLPERTIKGGTGYNIKAELAPEVDGMFPDYSIYPQCDYAIGYITRGCPNRCPWCVVPEKEGDIKPYRRWRELVRPDSNKLVLMDNNILSCEYGINELQSLIDSGYAVDLNQGMDARLVDERIAGILARLKWIRYIRFSCDTAPQIDAIKRVAAMLAPYGIKPYRLFIYALITKDIGDAARRVESLREIGNIYLYAQAERNEGKGVIPNAAQLEFAQRYVYKQKFRTETWREYCQKRNFDFLEVYT